MKVAEAGQYPALKIKLGTADDRAILTAIREGTDKELRVDANAGWTLERARQACIPAAVISHRDYPDKPGFEAAMDDALNAAGVELVCLAGFMRLLTSGFVERWHNRLINIHPSLLPSFKGLDTHARAIEAGVRFTGCTVHYVRPAMDEGPIILQAVVPILEGDDDHALADRVLIAEHRCYPAALKLIAEGRARVEGERVAITGAPATAPEPLLNPPV